MKTKIVLIPVDYHNARKVCERIENMKFKSSNQIVIHLLAELDGKNKGVLIYDISEFMDVVNNQELDILTEYFISYVNVEKKFA